MKALIIIVGFALIILCEAVSAECNKAYATVGAGYKFEESNKFRDPTGTMYFTGYSKYSARIEAGIQCNENLRLGIAHHSQWADGFPFNDKSEPYKTEFFVDYTFYWDI